jgi:dynein heavy chain
MHKINVIMEQLQSKEARFIFGLLSTVIRSEPENGATLPRSRIITFNNLLRWKKIDINITEAYHEAKDNVKYLSILDKFLEPLYSGTPATIIETLPVLLNALQMIYTISRHYNTKDRLTRLISKITNQMIANCKQSVLDGEDMDSLWRKDPLVLIKNLQSCIQLNNAYQDQYRVAKEALAKTADDKQFDLSEPLLFGRFDLFCRRVYKLIDMFRTIHQFRTLSQSKFDGLENVLFFDKTLDEFQKKRHDLLDFVANRFDRDYVEFNLRVSEIAHCFNDESW